MKLWGPESTKRQNSFRYRNSLACHIREQCFLSAAEKTTKSSFLLCLLDLLHSSFPTHWHFFLGSSQVAISRGGDLHRLQLLGWTLSCFINAKQSRSYRSINNTCRSGPWPIHYTFTIPSVYVQQPVVSWHRTADMSWLLLLRLLCVILGALFSRMKST